MRYWSTERGHWRGGGRHEERRGRDRREVREVGRRRMRDRKGRDQKG